MQWLAVRTNDGRDVIGHEDLRRSFVFEGQRVALMDAQRGIRKPSMLNSALSVRTVFRREGSMRPYEDAMGPDGLLRYKWRGDDPEHSENVALRRAMLSESPIIWFVGVAQGVYATLFPIYILWEEQVKRQFVLDHDVARGLVQQESPVEEHLRRYIIRESKQRLHQPVFRSTVLEAYARRCAVCALGHTSLLDAAHIVPDSEQGGVASVRNGLAMCKIHHAAFDARLLGVRPDLVVEISGGLLKENDGPMLKHGLQGRHGERLMNVPSRRADRPDPDLLEATYQKFRAAS